MIDFSLARPLPRGVGYVTQWFGENPANYARFKLAGHNGLDYGVPIGTRVLAAQRGKVEVGQDPAGYGTYVRVVNERMITIYAHLSYVTAQAGAEVQPGDLLGYSGNTGNSTGPHLHFGVKLVGGRNPAYLHWVDPVPFRT